MLQIHPKRKNGRPLLQLHTTPSFHLLQNLNSNRLLRYGAYMALIMTYYHINEEFGIATQAAAAAWEYEKSQQSERYLRFENDVLLAGASIVQPKRSSGVISGGEHHLLGRCCAKCEVAGCIDARSNIFARIIVLIMSLELVK